VLILKSSKDENGSFAMNALKWVPALCVGALALGGCAVMPEGPTVRVMPAPGKPIEVFDQDDQFCRGYAERHAGGNAQEAANASAVGSAAVGTALGAAAGALIGGNSRSAGTGAGVGLLMGSAAGSEQSARSGYGLQRRYDNAYTQCMYSKGNIVPGQAIPHNGGYNLPPAPPPPPPPPSYGPPPGYSPPPGYPPPPPPQ
jgi:hypothetical protein